MDTADRRQPGPGSHVRGLPAESLARIQAAASEGQFSRFSSMMQPSELGRLAACGFSPRGIVLGSSIVHAEIPYGGYFHNQELPLITAALAQARRDALARLIDEATALKADGVINVQLEMTAVDWAETTLECCARGDAVTLHQDDNRRLGESGAFITTFGVEECQALFAAGLRPAGIVFGNCVYHVAHQGFVQSLRQTGSNAEVPKFSQAIAGAREVAIARMESDPQHSNMSGILGISVAELRYHWRSHVSEFTARGNAVAVLETAAETTEFRKYRFKNGVG